MNFFVRQAHKTVNVAKTYLSLDENTRRWNRLRDKYAGRRVFLIGNGPSLNETPLYALRDELTLCFNRFHLLHERLSWRPHFYMCIDPEVLPDISAEINEHAAEYRWVCLHALHSSKIVRRDNVLLMHHVVQVPYFSRRLPLFGSGGTVAYAGLQMLFYLGVQDIILIGVDQNYVIHTTAVQTSGIRIQSQHDDDPNHFDPRYFGAGRRYHQPVTATQKRMIRAFSRAKEIGDREGIRIRNAGIGGALEVYDRVAFDDLFKHTVEDRYSLLAASIDASCSPELLRDLIRRESPETTFEGPQDLFVAEQEIGRRMIPKLILTHVPFGPVEGRYLFIRREKRLDLVKKLAGG